QDLASIYDFQAQQRLALHRENRTAMDGGDYYPNHSYGERKPSHDKQEPVPLPPELWFALMSEHQQSAEFDDMISHFNSTFSHTQLPLYRQIEELQKQQKALEERRNNSLPTSLAEFNLITSREHQNRIARSLVTRGQLPIGEYDTPENVQALQHAYETDEAAASTKTKDPRPRPLAGQSQ
ncbi:15254_t:CDS:2, partial [Acaulospora colombiana]